MVPPKWDVRDTYMGFAPSKSKAKWLNVKRSLLRLIPDRIYYSVRSLRFKWMLIRFEWRAACHRIRQVGLLKYLKYSFRMWFINKILIYKIKKAMKNDPYIKAIKEDLFNNKGDEVGGHKRSQRGSNITDN